MKAFQSLVREMVVNKNTQRCLTPAVWSNVRYGSCSLSQDSVVSAVNRQAVGWVI